MRNRLTVYEKILKIMSVEELSEGKAVIFYSEEYKTPIEKILPHLPDDFIARVKEELQEKFNGKDFFWLG